MVVCSLGVFLPFVPAQSRSMIAPQAEQAFCVWVYLNPNTGRFWTMDSYAGSNEDPLLLHKYLYCHDNPVTGLDPSGHDDIGSMMMAMDISAGLDALPGLSITPMGALSGGSTCGPDVTTLVDNTLDDVTQKWKAAPTWTKWRMSHIGVFDPFEIDSGWDIDQLYNLGSQQHAFDFGKNARQGTGSGAWTVQYDNHVYYAGAVNYILWGHMFRLFHREYLFEGQYSFNTAETLVGAYKAVISSVPQWAGGVGFDARAVLQAMAFTGVGWDENNDAARFALPIPSNPGNVASRQNNLFDWKFLSLHSN